MKTIDSVVMEFDLVNRSAKQISLNDLNLVSQESNKVYWIHCDLTDNNLLNEVEVQLKLPEEVIELCGAKNALFKLIDNDSALTVQIKCLASLNLTDECEIELDDLIIHLTQKYCFTASHQSLPILHEFFANCATSLHYAKTTGFILFLLIEGIINDYAKVLLNYEEVAERFDSLLHISHENIYKNVVDVKHETLKIKRYMISIREILMRLTTRNIQVISKECRSSLANLSTHVQIIINEGESIRELLNSLLGQIDNDLMQKMSETMTVLTAFAAIFLPLTLITGIYGMNFHWMPELEWKYGYFAALGFILFCGILLLLLFKRKKWL